jgi:hypothetical protein
MKKSLVALSSLDSSAPEDAAVGAADAVAGSAPATAAATPAAGGKNAAASGRLLRSFLCILLIGAASAAAAATASGHTVPAPGSAVPDPQLQQRLFALPKRRGGGHPSDERQWLGADCGTSLALPNGSTLWLFGDTLLGSWADDRRVLSDCMMPHQTVGIQPNPAGPISFRWRENGTEGGGGLALPLNLFWAPDGLEAPKPCASPFAETSAYYWVVSGIESGSTGLESGRLLLLAQRIKATPGEGLGFFVLGTTVIAVDSSVEPTDWWSRHQKADLTTCTDDAHCETWASGVFAAPDCGPGCVYLVGSLGSAAAGYGQALLRGNLSTLLDLDFTQLELLCSDGVWRPHNPLGGGSSHKPISLFPQQPELTLHFSPRLKKWVTASFDGFGGKRLLLWSTQSEDIRAPWASRLVYTLPPPWSNASLYYSYAVKIHPHLLGGAGATGDGGSLHDEIAISYVSNAFDMDGLFSEEEDRIYTPQLLRLKLA